MNSAFSTKYSTLKKYVVKFEGFVPNPILIINNSNIIYFKINKIQLSFIPDLGFDRSLRPVPKLKALGC